MVKQGKSDRATAAPLRVGDAIRRKIRVKAKSEGRLRPPLPGPFTLATQALSMLRIFWKPLGGILLIYLTLNFIFSGGIGKDYSLVAEIKGYIQDSPTHLSALGSALAGFGLLASGSDGSGTSASTGFTSILLVIVSLTTIWALRHLIAGQEVSVKESYYQAMKPLVPFLLIILVIFLQLLPMSIGAALLNTVLRGTVTDSQIITIVFSFLFVALSVWTVYMLTSSILALYIVTLPDRHPRQALRSAKKVVASRRWPVLFRLAALPVFILVSMAVVIVPLIFWAAPLVLPAYFALSGVALLFTHTYLYNFYRSLIE
ncbi:MAG: hypothetical protein WD887_01365 [Candidatus Saccharimonadales bacterium]